MTLLLPKLLLIGLMARNSTANPSKYHLLLEELSSLNEEAGEVVEEVSEVVVEEEEDLILT